MSALARSRPAPPSAASSLSDLARETAARLAPRPVAPGMVADFVRAADALVVIAAGLAAMRLSASGIGPWAGSWSGSWSGSWASAWFGSGAVASSREAGLFEVAGVIGAGPCVALGVRLLDGYRARSFRAAAARIGSAAVSLTITLGLALGATLALAGPAPGFLGAFLLWWGLALAGLAGARLALAPFVRRWIREGRLERRAVVVGGGAGAEALIADLAGESEGEVRVCGVFDDRGDHRSPPVLAGCPKLGTVAELVEFGRCTPLDLLIVALPMRAEARLVQLLDALWVLPVDIRLLAVGSPLKFTSRAYSHAGSTALLDLLDRPIARWDGVVKRVFDVGAAASLLVLLSPLLLLTALVIKLDSRGPVFFRQDRHGFNNEVFRVWKFRSLYADRTDHAMKQAVTRGDPRVTRVGRFIRRTSIDEVPQLLNVLTGELSLVGPRPHPVHAHTESRTWDQIVDGYFARHKVKPGITGWAQVNGWRGEVDTPEKIRRRVEHDIHYIENWSVLLDLRILAMTPLALVVTRDAF